ncbi:hypothetical protein C8039_12215 [Halogeometricum sp. wsp3]|nr:hypothetical protein C8039_12215 [Halogeometricum sp. wsp3]
MTLVSTQVSRLREELHDERDEREELDNELAARDERIDELEAEVARLDARIDIDEFENADTDSFEERTISLVLHLHRRRLGVNGGRVACSDRRPGRGRGSASLPEH